MAKKKVVRKKAVKKTVRSGAKSRTTAARKKTAAKPARKKTATKKKPVAKKKPALKASPTRKKAVKKKVAVKKAPVRTTAKKTTKKKTSLGRPRVPADARLDLVFQKDYQAREVFQFLGVSTVRELERFGADEIIQKLTSPMIQTVGRIRKALAVANRSLAGDQKFAKDFQVQFKLGK
jgi:DNA-nicking Smr family endonuclease